MLQQSSFFEGHRGGVLSLSGDSQDNYFYSSGSEGLIVRWQLDKPNEGQVLIKLAGYVSSIVYSKEEEQIYAAVNHKGIYVLNAKSGSVIKLIDLPATSFGSIDLTLDFIIITTKLGEIIFLESSGYKIVKRIRTGLAGFSQVAIGSNLLWYTTPVGIRSIDFTKMESKADEIEITALVNSIELMSDNLIIVTQNSISMLNLKKKRLDYELIKNEGVDFRILVAHPESSDIYLLTSKNEFLRYKVSKQQIELVEKFQFEHKEEINDLLWVENYKFVISASADKKIGVWQIN